MMTRAGSMRNLNKQGYKFQVSISIETIDKILSASDVLFSWERNASKVVQTKPFKVDKDSRIANFQNEKLTQEITFFKKKKSGAPFEEKVFRCIVKDANNPKKVVGKIELNFAQMIDIPSNSKRMAADLNNGSKLIMKFESKFLSEVDKKKSKRKGKDNNDDTSSINSYNTDTDDLESEFDPKDQDVDLADLADLEDLQIDDPPTNSYSISSNSSAASGHRNAPPSNVNNNSSSNSNFNTNNSQTSANSVPTNNNVIKPPLAPSPSYDDSLTVQQPKYSRKMSNNVNQSANAPPAKPNRGRRSRDPSPVSTSGSAVQNDGDSVNAPGPRARKGTSKHENNNNPNEMNGHSSTSTLLSSSNKELKQEIESLRKENRIYKRRNEDLQSRVSDLEYKLADVTSNQSTSSFRRSNTEQATEIDDLYSENKSLKEHIGELQIQIRREPTYADVVKELRESKMALAIINLEKDELKQQLRKMQR